VRLRNRASLRFFGDLCPSKSIAVIHAATHLANDEVTRAATALAAEEMAAQAEITAA
jgi:hypothetical protein